MYLGPTLTLFFLFCFFLKQKFFTFFRILWFELQFGFSTHYHSKKASGMTKATVIVEPVPTKQAELMNTVALTEQAELMKAAVPSELS